MEVDYSNFMHDDFLGLSDEVWRTLILKRHAASKCQSASSLNHQTHDLFVLDLQRDTICALSINFCMVPLLGLKCVENV